MGSTRPGWRFLATAALPTLAIAAAATACVSLEGLTGGNATDDAVAAGGDAAILADARGRADPSEPIQPSPPAADGGGPPGAIVAPADASPGDPVDALDAGCTSDAAILFALGAPMTASPPFGGDSGTAFADTCPRGAVLVGLNLVADLDSPYALYQAQALCSMISVGACSGALSLGAAAPLGDHGAGAGETGTVQCPAGSVVIGMSAFAREYVHSVTLQCARPGATLLADGGATLTLGAAVSVGPVGGAGGDALSPFQCPSPAVANALSGTVGGTAFVDSLAIGCATATRE